jgi:hypothetical protein
MSTKILRRVVSALALAATAALTSASPAAASYAAEITSYCCYATLEQGDTVEQYFEFRNTGDQTWFRDGAVPVNLGASNPYDRSSLFYTAGDWPSPGRLTGLDAVSTPPGQLGRFTWIATAPAPGDYTEYYTPVAELVNWMSAGDNWYLKYHVIAAQAPVVRITAAPARVARGSGFTVSADATDNLKVARVTFTAGSQVVTVNAPTQGTSGFTAALNAGALGTGTQTVEVTAYDSGGRKSSSSTAFEVFDPPPGPSTRLGSFQPLFLTKAGTRGRLGTFYGFDNVVGLKPGTRVRMVCTLGCTRKLRATKRSSSSGHVRIRLSKPMRLLRSTHIELRALKSGYVTRFQRYDFRRRGTSTRAHFLSAGCLASEKPRRVVRCPP